MQASIPMGTLVGGRWKITGVLGAGGFGQVMLAEDTSEVDLGEAALKVLHPNTTPQERTDFLVEVKKIAGLRHPNLVGYLDSGHLQVEPDATDPGPAEIRPYLVTERCEQSLADHLQRSPTGTLSGPETLAVLADVAAGLAHLHERGLIHRDIKPGNALYADGRWKLGDFGLMRDLSATGSYHRAGTLMGTPLFMAPELFASMVTSPASDIYAVGVLAHLCSTGRHLHQGTGQGLVLNVATQPPAIDATLPPELYELVARCTQADPAQRPSATTLAELVAQAQGRADGRAGTPWPPPADSAGQGHLAPAVWGPPTGDPVPAKTGTPRLLVMLAGSFGGLVLVGAMVAALWALTGDGGSDDTPDQVTTAVSSPTPGDDGDQSATATSIAATNPTVAVTSADNNGAEVPSTGAGGGVYIGSGVSIVGNVIIEGGGGSAAPLAEAEARSFLAGPVCAGPDPAPTVEVVNRHDTPVDYRLHVYHFDTAGIRVGDSYGILEAIAPGQRALLSLAPTEDSAVTCEVAEFTVTPTDPALAAATAQVTISSCVLDTFFGDLYDVVFTVTNPTSVTIDAGVTLAVVDAEGVVIDQALEETISDIGPGQSVQGKSHAFYSNIDNAPRPPSTCIASRVELTPR